MLWDKLVLFLQLFALSALLFPESKQIKRVELEKDGMTVMHMGEFVWTSLAASAVAQEKKLLVAGWRVDSRKVEQEAGRNPGKGAGCGCKQLIQSGEELLTMFFSHSLVLSFPYGCELEHLQSAACQPSRYPPLAAEKAMAVSASAFISCARMQWAKAQCFVTIFTILTPLWAFFLFKTY